MMNRLLITFIALASAAVMGAATKANAQNNAEKIVVEASNIKASSISLETFFRRPEFDQMSLSPSGDFLAAVSPFKGRGNLVVIDLTKRSRQILTSFETTDVANFYWVNNKRICMRVADGQDVTGNVTYRGTYCVNTDGTEFSDFTRIDKRNSADQGRVVLFNPVRPVGGESNDYIVSMPARTSSSSDLYRFNTITGRYTLLTFNSPGDVDQWILDRNQVSRIAITSEPRKGKEHFSRQGIWYRESADAKWEQLAENRASWGYDISDVFLPIAFDFDNTTLYVASNAGRDKMAIYKYDTKTRKLGDLVFEHPLIDVSGGLLFSNEKKKLVGIRYNAEMPATKWLDPELETLQKQIDLSIPNHLNQIGVVEEKSKRLLMTSVSPTNAGQYYLFDNETKSIEPLVKRRDWLPPSAMSERKFILYKARDGMEIPAWVTIPKNSNGKNLPLLVHVHGGPQVRVYNGLGWGGRSPISQFFASRGYVVLEPEPRGGKEFGRKHSLSAKKQWGQAMQDDITDGALHLAKEGIVDKNRMCIYGGSYGGYASLQALVRDPDLWQCSAPFVAVTSLILRQTVQHSDTAQFGDNVLDTEYAYFVGDSVRDKEMFIKNSPTENTSVINKPILLAMGADDQRVPIIMGTEFMSKMERAGKRSLVEYVIYKGEGHGFNKDANVIDHMTRLERFVAKHIGDETQKKVAQLK
jgi:dipeptidyl aminopeptidase/acylaminoacyl peptidase